MEEVGDRRETVVRKRLVLVLNEAQWHLADERCPPRVGAPRSQYAVAHGESGQIRNVAIGHRTEAPAAATLEEADVEGFVAADEEADAAAGVCVNDAQHHLVILFQRIEIASAIERAVVAVADVDTHHQVGLLAQFGHHLPGMLHDVLAWLEDVLQFFLRLFQIARVVHGVPPLLEPQQSEYAVPPLVVGHLPRQSLVVVPPVASLQVPLVPQGEVDERTMQQVGETLDGPVVEDDDHRLPLGHAASHAGYVGPQPVAGLSGCVADDSHSGGYY